MYHRRIAHPGLVLLLFAAGCSESGVAIDPVRAGDAMHRMSDGAPNALERSYSPAPMVEDPTYGDIFPNASPLVEVCAIVNSFVSKINSSSWSPAWFPSAVRCHGITDREGLSYEKQNPHPWR